MNRHESSAYAVFTTCRSFSDHCTNQTVCCSRRIILQEPFTLLINYLRGITTSRVFPNSS